jgi:CBS domain-containing protein
MQSPVVTVAPTDPLTSVRRLFADEAIHGAPVVDETGLVRGVITSADLMRSAASGEGPAPASSWREEVAPEPPAWELADDVVRECAEDVMTDSVVQVPPDASVAEVARRLREEGVHRIMVVDDQDVIGIISTFDLLRLIEEPSADATEPA